MKQALSLVISLLVCACGSSNDIEGPDKTNSPSGESSDQFSMSLKEMNICGETSPYTHYELMAKT